MILENKCCLRGIHGVNREPAVAVCQLDLPEIKLIQTLKRCDIGCAHFQQLFYVLEASQYLRQ
jgi:hypothetical protein